VIKTGILSVNNNAERRFDRRIGLRSLMSIDVKYVFKLSYFDILEKIENEFY